MSLEKGGSPYQCELSSAISGTGPRSVAGALGLGVVALTVFAVGVVHRC